MGSMDELIRGLEAVSMLQVEDRAQAVTYIEQAMADAALLSRLNTDGIEPLILPSPAPPVLREDIAAPAAEAEEHFYFAPRAVEK